MSYKEQDAGVRRRIEYCLWVMFHAHSTDEARAQAMAELNGLTELDGELNEYAKWILRKMFPNEYREWKRAEDNSRMIADIDAQVKVTFDKEEDDVCELG